MDYSKLIKLPKQEVATIFKDSPHEIESFLDYLTSNEDEKSYDLIDWLDWLISGGEEPNQFFDYLKDLAAKNTGVCGKSWESGTLFYQCRTCGLDPFSAICVDCFLNGNHEGHDYFSCRSGLGMCDCEAWNPKGFCKNHKGRPENPETIIPGELRARIIFSVKGVLKYLMRIIEERAQECFTLSEYNTDLNVDTIVTKFGELSQLLESHRSNSLCIKIIRWLTNIMELGDGTLRVATQQFYQLNVESELTIYGYKSKETSLLDPLTIQEKKKTVKKIERWIINANQKEIIQKQIIEQSIDPKDEKIEEEVKKPQSALQTFINFAQFERGKMYVEIKKLLYKALTDLKFKEQFAICFLKAYPEFMKRSILVFEKEEMENNITEFSAQLFTLTSLIPTFCERDHLLEVLIQTLEMIFRMALIPHPYDSKKTKFIIDCENRLIRDRQAWYTSEDFQYSITKLAGSNYMMMKNQSVFAKLLKVFRYIQGINPIKRKQREHVMFESRLWVSAYTIEVFLYPIVDKLEIGFASGENVVDPHISKEKALIPGPITDNLLAKIRGIISLCLREIFDWASENNEIYSDLDEKIVDVKAPLEYPFKYHRIKTFSYDVSAKPVSMHFPLHRILSAFIARATTHWGVTLEQIFSIPKIEDELIDNKNIELNEKDNQLNNNDNQLIEKKSIGLNEKDNQIIDIKNPKNLVILLTHITRLQAVLGQIYIGIWVRNGQSITHQANLQRNPMFSTFCIDRDIFLLQTIACLLEPVDFITNTIACFEVFDWFQLDKKKVAGQEDEKDSISDEEVMEIMSHILPSAEISVLPEEKKLELMEIIRKQYKSRSKQKPDEDLIKLKNNYVYHLLKLFMYIVIDRSLSGKMTKKDILRREIIHILCETDLTHSELVRRIPKSMHEDVDISEILYEVAEQTGPQDEFVLRKNFWKEYEGHYFLHYTNSQVQVSEERYFDYLNSENRTRQIKLPVHVPLPKFRETNPAFKVLPRVISSHMFHTILFTILHNAVAQNARTSDLLVLITLHFVHLCLELDPVYIDDENQDSQSIILENDPNDEKIVAETFTEISFPSASSFVRNSCHMINTLNGEESFVSLIVALYNNPDQKDNIELLKQILKLFSQKNSQAQKIIANEIPDFQKKIMNPDWENTQKMIQEKQRLLMQQFLQKQKNFQKSNQDELNSLDSTNDLKELEKSKEENDREDDSYDPSESSGVFDPDFSRLGYEKQVSSIKCVLCRDSISHIEKPLCLISLIQNSHLCRIAQTQFENSNQILREKDDTQKPKEEKQIQSEKIEFKEEDQESKEFFHQEKLPEYFLSTCGHIVHYDCYQNYFNSINRMYSLGNSYLGSNSTDITRGEFLCSMDRKIANMIVPLIPTEIFQQIDKQAFDLMPQLLEDPKYTENPDDFFSNSISSLQFLSQSTDWISSQNEKLLQTLEAFMSQTYFNSTKQLITRLATSRMEFITLWNSLVQTLSAIEVSTRDAENNKITSTQQFLLRSLFRICSLFGRHNQTGVELRNYFRSSIFNFLSKGDPMEKYFVHPSKTDLFLAVVSLSSLFPTSFPSNLQFLQICKLVFPALVYQALTTFGMANEKSTFENSIQKFPLFKMGNIKSNELSVISNDSVLLEEKEVVSQIERYIVPFLRKLYLFKMICVDQTTSTQATIFEETNYATLALKLDLPQSLHSILSQPPSSWNTVYSKWAPLSLSLPSQKSFILSYCDPISFVQFPEVFQEIWRRYELSDEVDGKVIPKQAGMCLITGEIVNLLPNKTIQEKDQKNVIDIRTHSHLMGGNGLYLCIRGKYASGIITYLDGFGSLNIVSPYKDQWHETDVGVFRGKTLNLDLQRMKDLKLLFINHELFNEIIRTREAHPKFSLFRD
ncbi:ubiquitin ligase e3 alpha-related [Anaeramoeba ignava]|uniref:E3 ubiquitin-protein ligase n=1 Tax=Anaeramoeba ignava TaxID=1746090 RepID=A0A9Q0R863_ANAIG|nr:ubiquitin ligase e3 alpha-related [Anaeramoeba ignava]